MDRFDAIILGNGPSLIRFWEPLNQFILDNASRIISGELRIFGVNRVYLLSKIRYLNYYIALDKPCWTKDHEKLNALHTMTNFVGFVWERYLKDAMENCKNIYPYPLELAGFWDEMCDQKWKRNPLISPDYKNIPPMMHGGSSVIAAINLAYWLGAKSVHLFGVDLQGTEEESHFYGHGRHKPATWKRIQEKLEKIIVTCRVFDELDIHIYSDIYKPINGNINNNILHKEFRNGLVANTL